MFALLNRLFHRRRPGRRLPRREGRPRLGVEHLEDRRLMSVVTNPAPNPIIPNVQVETVFYGSVWSSGQQVTGYQNINGVELTNEAQDLDQFFATITKSSYMDGLSQYTGSNGAPGHGQFIGADFVAGLSPNGNNPANWSMSQTTSLSDQQIQGMLQGEMNSNRIPAPDGNKLYMVFLPPGVGVADGSGGGHHGSFTTTSGVRAYYAIIDHPLSGFSPGLGNSLTRLQQLTLVASHEMVEAITDPMVNYRTAWIDRNSKLLDPLSGQEIGDITQNQPPPGGWIAIDAGYVVQKYWSEQAQTSLAPGGSDFQPLQSVISTFPLTGINFSLYSEQNGQYVAIPVELVGWLSTNGGVYTYQVLWGAGKQDVRATVWVDGAHDELQIQIYNPEDSSVLFQGTLMAPELNWQAGDLEMSGTLFQNNGSFYAFGGQITPPAPLPTGGDYGGSGGGSFSSPFKPPRVVLA
jgi:hypothetical protein